MNPLTLVVWALSGATTLAVIAVCALAVVVVFIARSDGLS